MIDYLLPGMRIRDHLVTVPLDWSRPDDGRTIDVFAREVSAADGGREDLPILVFLQGGPGGKSPRPFPGEGWIASVLKTHRVLLLDQRGTGRSSRVQASSIAGMAGAEAAAYLMCFRADSIVADLEHLRRAVFGGVRWQTLGQSYGGFVTLSYLSLAPEGLSACYIAGGLAGTSATAEQVYRLTYPRVVRKNELFGQRFPQTAAVIAEVADVLDSTDVRLPDGDRLSTRRLQTLGIDLGMAAGFERLHWLFDEAFAGGRLSDTFLAQVGQLTTYDDNPLFAVMHESIYGTGSSGWAAERVRAEFPEFDTRHRPLLLTGEMIYPWMFEESRSLRPFRAAAEALAEYGVLPELYDEKRLAANEVPVAAVAYVDDMYVDLGLSMGTAELLGNCSLWATNEYEHDGIRRNDQVVHRLIESVSERGGTR